MRIAPSTGELIPVRGFSRWRDWRAEQLVSGSIWRSADGLNVTSSIADMELPGSDGLFGPTWLVSVSRAGERDAIRASDLDVLSVVERFEMPAWEEDNHMPGVARALFCPVDERYRVDCECKITETPMVEADGYRWSQKTGAECAGCVLERLSYVLAARRLPCPHH